MPVSFAILREKRFLKNFTKTKRETKKQNPSSLA